MGKFCCCNCIFSCVCACIMQILCAVIVILGIIALAIWLIFRPNKIYFHVADASLAKFDFSPSTNTLVYDLALSFDIRNSNKRIGVLYDQIEVKTSFHQRKFNNMNLETFYQGPENTTILQPTIKGQNTVQFGDSEKSNYNDEKKSGVFDIYTTFYMHIRFKSGWITTSKIKLFATCGLKVPLKSLSSSTFERTNCIAFPWSPK
ncbi:hypothetical protein T459_03393 [Capsicum annuum]|uniref:Uncharacterized protein n=2 Tax=Capsicum annuum TaxID=4072 RepID=A0A2G3AMP6_CAPAN|nr:putative 2-Cys peroxiredoxin BAS1-like, chloroplastic-like [Capsicum annuum]PHT95511.1 hypothetical protein T459_03393 [Capsicum annuum]